MQLDHTDAIARRPWRAAYLWRANPNYASNESFQQKYRLTAAGPHAPPVPTRRLRRLQSV